MNHFSVIVHQRFWKQPNCWLFLRRKDPWKKKQLLNWSCYAIAGHGDEWTPNHWDMQQPLVSGRTASALTHWPPVRRLQSALRCSCVFLEAYWSARLGHSWIRFFFMGGSIPKHLLHLLLSNLLLSNSFTIYCYEISVAMSQCPYLSRFPNQSQRSSHVTQTACDDTIPCYALTRRHPTSKVTFIFWSFLAERYRFSVVGSELCQFSWIFSSVLLLAEVGRTDS